MHGPTRSAVIPAHTWYATPSGALTFVNTRTADYLGLPTNHHLRLGIDIGAAWDSHFALLHPDDHDETRKVWSNCLATGSAGELTFRVRDAHGAYRWRLSRVERLRPLGIRVSVFVDPTQEAVRFAKACGADRVELYTEPFAQAFQQGKTSCEASFDRYAQAARLAHELGLGVNAGHDLDRHNLIVFRNLPHLDEVSIGHAIWAEALFHGIDHVVSDYLALLASAADPR